MLATLAVGMPLMGFLFVTAEPSQVATFSRRVDRLANELKSLESTSRYMDPGAAGATVMSQGYLPSASDRARVQLLVPPDAVVWFNGTRTFLSGSVRLYESPPLTPGARYSYRIQAQWTDNGRLVSQRRNVPVLTGSIVYVVFGTQVAPPAVSESVERP